MNKQNLDQLVQTILKSIPKDAAIIGDEIRSNLAAALEASLSRMNLVTREEFDSQTALLQRTRIKLERLEQELERLKENA